jgi:hypothetical protein
MTLRTAAAAVLARWDSPQWELTQHGPTADLMHVLRAELAQPAAPDVQPVAWIDKHGNIDRGLDAILSPDGWVPLYAAAQAAQPAPQPLSEAANAALAEVEKATRKFPTWPTDPLHALAVLGEEFGELTKDVLQMVYEPHKTNRDRIRTECVQTAAMALRFMASLDRYEYRPGEQHSQGGITAAPSDHIPDAGKMVPGWQWVPVEPTEAMLKAGVIALNGNAVYKNVATEALRIEEQMYAEVYEAMLAAAPPPPVRERLTDREADMLQALHSLLRHAERVNEVLGHECGVRFVDTGPLDMAREAIERATGEAQR